MLSGNQLLKLGFIFLILLGCQDIKGQGGDMIDVDIIRNGAPIPNPFTGGIIAAQISRIDLDNDGKKDLLVFDRNGDQFLPFLNKGGEGEVNYDYAPEYRTIFPPCYGWVLLRDFNGDGIEDIFSPPAASASIAVWKGSRENGNLSFTQMTFNGKDYILEPTGNNEYTNLYVSTIDIPAIVDVDGDTDLDILTFEAGGSKMFYYKNLVVEQNMGLDTFKYVLADNCWGKFFESGVSADVDLSTDADMCARLHGEDASGSRHAGSTVTAFDGDGDGDLDMILGDLTNSAIVYLFNGGSSEKAWITDQDASYPSNNVPVEMDVFLSSFYEDINNDGNRDLIVTPNEKNNSENQNHIWYYENTGTDAEPVFNLDRKDFLIRETFSVGNGSHPLFFDYNSDGLLDILVGSNGFYRTGGLSKDCRLFLLENTGSITEPEFEVVDEDYLGFSQYSSISSLRFAPATGDLDGDGDVDMLVGDSRGQLYYLENTAGPGKKVEFANPIYPYADINVGQNAKPQIVDLNKDGLADIVCGEKNDNDNGEGVRGGLNYFQNIGQPGNPQFNPDPKVAPNTNVLGSVYTRDTGFLTGSSAPYFYPLSDDYLCFVGAESGRVRVYHDVKDNIYSSFALDTEEVENIRDGTRTIPAVADINADGHLDLLLGNERGGLTLYYTDYNSGISSVEEEIENVDVVLFPNPVTDILFVESEEIILEAEIYDTQGQLIQKRKDNTSTLNISMSGMLSGAYYIKLITEKGMVVKQVIKI